MAYSVALPETVGAKPYPAAEPLPQTQAACRALIVAVFVTVVLLDYMSPANIVAGFLYLLALPPVLHLRSRRWLWAVVVVSALLTLGDALADAAAARAAFFFAMVFNRGLTVLTMVLLGTALDRYLISQSGRARAEAELRRLNEKLNLRVQQEVALREAAQAKLAHAQKMEALGQLAGGIAHDFNNVLQAVESSAFLIGQAPDTADGVRRLARTVLKAAERGALVTSRLLAFSRRSDLRTESLDPATLLSDLEEILSHTLGAGISVRVSAAPDLPSCLADRGQLETVLVNLAVNARDAMKGAGSLIFSASIDHFSLGFAPSHSAPLQPGSYVRLSVADSGPGMQASVLARITEPFFTTKPRGEGTGLGLAMARGFAEQSQGGLTVESPPGCGTTVTIWLPLAEPMDSVAQAPAITTPRQSRLGTLLLVDDDPVVRDLLAEVLQARGHTVLLAENAQQALDLQALSGPIDLVISDLSMPGMNGASLVRALRQHQAGLPALMLTGATPYASQTAIEEEAPGEMAVLRKPVSETLLADRVAALLSASPDAAQQARITAPPSGVAA